MSKTETLTIRCDSVFKEELDTLASLYGLNRTQVLYRLVHGDYLKSTEIGQKQIAETMSQFENLQKSLEALVNGTKEK